MRPLATIFLLSLLTLGLRAQSVRWDPPGGVLAAGQIGQIGLVFTDCEPDGEIALPKVAGLEFGKASQSTNSSFSFSFNGGPTTKTTQTSVTYTYPIRPSAGRAGIDIPAFDVTTKQGRQRVAAAHFSLGAAAVANSNGDGSVPLDSVAQSRFLGPDRAVWAGEVFPLAYQLDAIRSYIVQLSDSPEWDATPLAVEEWGKPDQTAKMVSDSEHLLITYNTRAVAKLPGDISFHPATQTVVLQTGTQNFGLFTRPSMDRFVITTEPAALTVKPLPTPAPADFNGAVGQFTLVAKVVPTTVAVGEPITWTVTLDGTGNWPDLAGLPPRTVSRDFHVVQPKAKKVPKDKALFDATLAEDIVLVPTKPGTYTIGPVTMSCFDPKSGQYAPLTTEQYVVTVTAPPLPPTAVTAGPNLGGPAGAENGLPAPKIPTPPAGIPRDPLPLAGAVGVPFLSSTVWYAALGSIAWLPLLWFGFALRRAWLTDSFRQRREARERLALTLGALPGAAKEKIPTLLQQWRNDTAMLWGIRQAEPTAAVFDRVDRRDAANAAGHESWSKLWNEADAALFGDRKSLPADWRDRAEAALATKRLPRFQPLRLFMPQNLLPLAIVFAALAMGHDARAEGADVSAAKAAYDAGDFAKAESAWRADIATAPTDWSARHNLALALSQQGRWGEAAGHALAAFVQQPTNPSTLWHLDLTLKNAGFMPAPAQPFVEADTLTNLAILASPADWQAVAIGAALLAAAALGLLLWQAYGARGRWIGPTAWTGLLAATLLGTAAILSLDLYGPLADRQAVLVWKTTVLRSIPTEVETTQKTTPLSAGQLAILDPKTFLGWRHLTFDNGQTGWVRQEDLVNLW